MHTKTRSSIVSAISSSFFTSLLSSVFFSSFLSAVAVTSAVPSFCDSISYYSSRLSSLSFFIGSGFTVSSARSSASRGTSLAYSD